MKPMLFSAPMVRALLEGRKTQTRRIMKLQPDPGWTEIGIEYPFGRAMATYRAFPKSGPARWAIGSAPFSNGDEVCVREAWKTCAPYDSFKPAQIDGGAAVLWLADDAKRLNGPEQWGRYRHARFMPRWASRITLKVTDVRVQRLQDISKEDAKAEGLKCLSKDGGRVWKWGIPDADGEPGNDDVGWHWQDWETSPVQAYRRLWEAINGKGSWAADPWVWAYTFQRIA